MKKTMIVANWKMYSTSARDIASFIKKIRLSVKKAPLCDVVIAPPFPYFSFFKNSKLALGAQDVFWEEEGSFTGEVSSAMLRDFGVKYVIVGHSERRTHMGETNLQINKKIKHALSRGLYPILCVGEDHRDQDGQFFATIKEQIQVALSKIPRNLIGRITIAYEPVWAIGSGKPARPEDANEAALFIKKTFAQMYGIKLARTLKVLYGGSVQTKNAAAYLQQREVSGLLVGRESLSAESFSNIIQCAHNL